MAYFRAWALRGAFAATVGASASLAPGCSDVLGVDDHKGVAEELCTLIEQCYGPELYPDCLSRVGDRLESTEPGVREQYLTAFADGSCLETCTNARACLDGAPLCDATGQACSGVEQCCGFASGVAQCKGSACCVPLGVACNADTPCCADECIDGTCGGFTCRDQGESCEIDDECCGDFTCNADKSSTCQPCAVVGGECTTSEDCCRVSGVTCQDGKCKEMSACKNLGENCSDDCCSSWECHTIDNTAEPTCCKRAAESCLEPSDCCSGACKAGVNDALACCNETGGCSADAECCSGSCEVLADGSNLPNLVKPCCVPKECADPCAAGPVPLHPQCGFEGEGLTTEVISCVLEVCADSPECCCSAWSASCVEAFKSCSVTACQEP